jgi:predicted transcriptional regulator
VNGVPIEGASVAGRPVTDADIQAWADEAERGYDVSRLKPRGRPLMGDEPAKITTIRLEPSLDAALDERVARDGSTRSEVIRSALRAWLESA